MIVDDHRSVREVVRSFAQTAGAECVECEDGYAALREWPGLRPDLVLMDISMQGLDGIETTTQLKAAYPEARVVMLTQYDDPDLRRAARNAGAEAYLLKDDLSVVKPFLQTRAEGREP